MTTVTKSTVTARDAVRSAIVEAIESYQGAEFVRAEVLDTARERVTELLPYLANNRPSLTDALGNTFEQLRSCWAVVNSADKAGRYRFEAPANYYEKYIKHAQIVDELNRLEYELNPPVEPVVEPAAAMLATADDEPSMTPGDDSAVVDLQTALNQAFATARHRIKQGYDASAINQALSTAIKGATELYLSE